MSRKDADASLEKAYISRFRGRSTACRKAMIEIDLRAEGAVANAVTFEAFIERYKEETGHDLGQVDARFYGMFFERLGQLRHARNWFEALDALGDDRPLREFFVRYGLVTKMLKRFEKPTPREFERMVEANMKRLDRQKVYEVRRLEEAIKGCTVGNCRQYLPKLLDQAIRDAQVKPAARLAQVLGRELTPDEAKRLGEMLIVRKLHEPMTYTYVKNLSLLGLAATYIDALITDCEGRADEVFGRAKDLDYVLTTAQLEELYKSVEKELGEDRNALHPNIWVPVIEELARRSPEWAEKIDDAYERAVNQTLTRAETGEAEFYANKQGIPLRPIELLYQVNGLNNRFRLPKQHATRSFAKTLLHERVGEIVTRPPTDDDGKPKPD